MRMSPASASTTMPPMASSRLAGRVFAAVGVDALTHWITPVDR